MKSGGLLTMQQGVISWLRAAKRRVSANRWRAVDDLLRSFLMAFILKPATRVLPRKAALRVARLCGAVMLRVPPSGKPALATMQKAFSMERADARETAREYLTEQFYSFVIFQRVLHGRENPENWTIEERNSRGVAQLRESGRSFIVATGHFGSQSRLALYLPRICPGSLAAVTVPLAARSLSPYNIRERIHFGQILKVARQTRPNVKFMCVGDPSILELLDHLKQPNGQLLVAVDAFWTRKGRSTDTRPFAAMSARSFSIGSAVLSRMAQCPIVACANYVANDGTVVLEWGPVIPPPHPEDKAADLRTTNALLDFLEIAVGKRPSQYVLHIGEERRWNPVLQTWEDPTSTRAVALAERAY
jgi:lauroyl/myristoyl acyltransferase